MKLRKKFMLEIHEDFGLLGLRPVDVPHADPLGSMAVAHDMLEHFKGDDGGVEAELMALGAAIYTRGETGYFLRGRGNPDTAANISSDFVDIARHNVFEGFSFESPGRTVACDEYAEEIIQEVVRTGQALLRSEFQPEDGIGYWTGPEHSTP